MHTHRNLKGKFHSITFLVLHILEILTQAIIHGMNLCQHSITLHCENVLPKAFKWGPTFHSKNIIARFFSLPKTSFFFTKKGEQ